MAWAEGRRLCLSIILYVHGREARHVPIHMCSCVCLWQVAWTESKTAKAILAAWLVSVQTSARESGVSRPASSASTASNGV